MWVCYDFFLSSFLSFCINVIYTLIDYDNIFAKLCTEMFHRLFQRDHFIYFLKAFLRSIQLMSFMQPGILLSSSFIIRPEGTVFIISEIPFNL